MTDQTIPAQKFQMPDTFFGEVRALLVLGIPMALAQLIQFSIYTVDTIMLGRVGPEVLAAAALGTVVYFLLWMIGAGPVMAVSPMVSQALGADQNNRRDARKSVRMALWLIAFMTPALFALLFFVEPILLAAGQDPDLSRQASYYMMALAPGWPFALFVMILRNFLAAIEKTRIPLILIAASVLINTGLNALLIFGMLGFPRLELVGAGIASSLSYFINFLMFVAYIQWDKDARRFRIFKNFFRAHWDRFREVARLGWPISVTTIFEGMLFNACVLLMGLIGKMEVAAYQIALNVAALAFMLPFGMSMAGGVRVGLAAGAENAIAVRRSGVVTILVCILLIMIFAIPIALWPNGVAQIYLNVAEPGNETVVNLVTVFLPIAAAFMLFDATQVAANQMLRGLKDVTVPMWMTGISYWVVGFPLAWYLGLHTEFAASGVWIGLLVSLICASIFLGGRFYWLAWRKMR